MRIHKAEYHAMYGWRLHRCEDVLDVNARPQNLSRTWKNVTCKKCLKLKGVKK